MNEQKENNKKSTNTKIQNKIETIKFNANERYEIE